MEFVGRRSLLSLSNSRTRRNISTSRFPKSQSQTLRHTPYILPFQRLRPDNNQYNNTYIYEKFGNKESYRFSRRISELSESYGGDKLSVWTDSRFWWSSTERKDNVAQIVDFGMPLQTRLVNVYAYRSDRNHVRTKTWQQFVEAGWEKTGKWPVRAVHKF